MLSTFKRLVVGRPIASSEEQHQRLSKVVALPVFASDAISSTAYASEEILLVLVPVGGLVASIDYLIPLSLVVIVLLTIVVSSYRQTVFAYPSGGGSYVVSRENLGETPSLVAGASLLVDYGHLRPHPPRRAPHRDPLLQPDPELQRAGGARALSGTRDP